MRGVRRSRQNTAVNNIGTNLQAQINPRLCSSFRLKLDELRLPYTFRVQSARSNFGIQNTGNNLGEGKRASLKLLQFQGHMKIIISKLINMLLCFVVL